jgi:hypothetical protein
MVNDSASSSEQILSLIMDVYEANGGEMSYIECLAAILEETELSETEIAALLDDNAKMILKENSAKNNYFRKSFYEKQVNVLDI